MSDNTGDAERPVSVFLDACVFEGKAFHYENPVFQAIVARAETGQIELIIPDVTRREVLSRIAKSVRKARKALTEFRKSAGALRSLVASPLAGAFGDVDWGSLRKQMEQRFSRFLETAHVQVLAVATTDGADVLDDYFGCKAPFGSSMEKSEFPDAFALRALLRHAASSGRRITVVSADKDWKAMCKQYNALERAESPEEVLERSLAAATPAPEDLRSMLEPHRTTLEDRVLDSFRCRGFYLVSDELADAEINETSDEEIVSWNWAVIDQDEHVAEIAGDAKISFGVHVTYPDPDMCHWDSEDQEMMVFGYESARLLARAAVPVTFKVNLDELVNGGLDVEELVVNDGADVSISDYDVEERWSRDG